MVETEIASRDAQESKEPLPNEVTPSGIKTDLREEQPTKAPFPKDVTLSGMMMLSREEQ